jgi:hypothetical protein
MAVYKISSVLRDLAELRHFSVQAVLENGTVVLTGDATFIFDSHGLLSAERDGKPTFMPGKPVPFSALHMQSATREAVDLALERTLRHAHRT